MKVLDAYGRSLEGPPPMSHATTVKWAMGNSSYPSRGLTPERLTQIFEEADMGNVLRQCELYEEMEEKDAHLGAVLQSRKLAVAGLQWELTPPTDTTEDAQIASFIGEVLNESCAINELSASLMDAVAKGFAVQEIIWRLNGRRATVERLQWWPQRCFTFLGKDGASVSQSPALLTDNEPVFGEPLTPGKFIVHSYRGRSVWPSRAGLLRPCAYMYLFKNYTLKDWMIFNERYAMPLRIGRYSPGASAEERRVLKQAVFNLGSDAAAVISDSTVLELLESDNRSASAEVYGRMIELCDCAMSKAVLGHTASADSTPGRLGSEDMAREIRRDILEADAKALAQTLTQQLIRPLVLYNFGPQAKWPALRFVTD